MTNECGAAIPPVSGSMRSGSRLDQFPLLIGGEAKIRGNLCGSRSPWSERLSVKFLINAPQNGGSGGCSSGRGHVRPEAPLGPCGPLTVV